MDWDQWVEMSDVGPWWDLTDAERAAEDDLDREIEAALDTGDLPF